MVPYWAKAIRSGRVMERSKGMTLIEVVISITILGAIAIMTLPYFVNNYKILINTRQIIKNVYTAQDDIEDKIKKAEEQIEMKNGNPAEVVDGTAHNYTIFGAAASSDRRTVVGYDNEVAIRDADHLGNSNKKLFTVVVDTYSDGMPVASITNATMKMLVSGSVVDKAYANRSDLSLNTTITLSDPLGVNYMNVYRWYVSKEGFYTTPKANPAQNEKGTLYPVFPNDYSIIAGQDTENLSANLQSYAGRYLVCTVTPGSRLGKMGITVDTNPIYLSGLTVTNDLLLHLDTSMINQDDTNCIKIDGVTRYVMKWISLGSSSNTATPQNVINTAPYNLPTYMQSEVKSSDLSKIRNFKYLGYTKAVKLITNNYVNMTYDKFTAFLVVRNIDGTTGNILSYDNTWSLSPNSSGGVDFSSIKQDGSEKVTVSSNTSINDGAWHIIKLVSNTSGLSVSIDGGIESYSSSPASSTSAGKKLTIGNAVSGDIAEVILYASSSMDEAKVMQYLSNKYRP